MPEIGWQNYRAAIDIAGLLIEAGETDQAGALLDRAAAAIADKPIIGQYGRGIAMAEILALSGDRDGALAELKAAFDGGWRMRWWLWTTLNPNMASLRDDPEFLRIVADLESEIATQLDLVRDLESGGSLAPLLDTTDLTES